MLHGGEKAHSPEMFSEVISSNSLVKTPELLPSATLREKQIFSCLSCSAKPNFSISKAAYSNSCGGHLAIDRGHPGRAVLIYISTQECGRSLSTLTKMLPRNPKFTTGKQKRKGRFLNSHYQLKMG